MSEEKLKVVLLQHTPYPEEVVAQAAKLCYSHASIGDLQKQIAGDDQTGFVGKLVAVGHLSPFEHISFTFGVEGISRACSHQLVRHRLASYSQQSQRYVGLQSGGKADGFGYILPESIKMQRKLSFETFVGGGYTYGDGKRWFNEKMEMIQLWYDELVENGVPAEDARFILPNACETKIIITMNARELLHFFRVRCCNRAQWEIRAMATEMLRLSKSVAPTVFKEAGPGCVTGECPEGKMSCGKMDEVRMKFQS